MNSTYFLNLVSNHTFGIQVSGSVPTLPTDYYIGLSTTAPTAAGGNVSEPASSAGYARVKITGLSASSGGATSNTAAISFPESTASWGTITHFVVFDSLTSGNLLMYGSLSASRVVEASTTMTIPIGNLTLTIQNAT